MLCYWAARGNETVYCFIPEAQFYKLHGFFAEMGDFVLAPIDSTKFSINSKQLCCLVSKGYIAMPEVTRRDITDRTKADYFAKFVTIFQAHGFSYKSRAEESHTCISPH